MPDEDKNFGGSLELEEVFNTMIADYSFSMTLKLSR